MIKQTAILLQVADGLLTYIGVSGHVSQEANPLIASLMPVLGVAGALLLVKSIAVTWLWLIPARFRVTLIIGSIWTLVLGVLPWSLLLLSR